MTAPTWDLEVVFPGGLAGAAYQHALSEAEALLDALVEQADALPSLSPATAGDYEALLLALYGCTERLSQVGIFAHSHACADTREPLGMRMRARAMGLWTRHQRAWVPLKDLLASSAADAFAALLARPALAEARPSLERIRRQRALQLPRAEAALATELSRDGIQAWGQHHSRISGRLEAHLPDGRVVSASQAHNLLSHPEAEVRRGALAALDAAWGTVAEDCAAALSHIVGTRQILLRRLGTDPRAGPLAESHMRRESLEAMLEAARRAGPLLERYLAVKARLLGVERLHFADLTAPVGSMGAVSWEEARALVEAHFASYSDDLAQMARRAFAERWIEAEDRPGKVPGAWCGRIGLSSGMSRIFMTFGGSFRSTTTLAHELGHAYHNWVLRDLHPALREVPATLAETASIFAENIVRDAALAAAPDDSSRVAMLDERLAAATSFLMDIPFRFRLDLALYDLRAQGMLDPEELCARTVELQRESYRDALSGWFPHFWASKMHFYMAERPFYNYPYTFGYLFSSLVYQRIRAEGPGGTARYLDLLRRTGWQDAEPLVAETLGIDITRPEDWALALVPLEQDLAALEVLAPPR